MRLGKPPEQEAAEYQAVPVDRVVFYIHSSCSTLLEGDDIRLELERVLFGKKLVLLGFKIEND